MSRKSPSLSFSGCGFLGIYHVGVGACLKEHAPDLIRNAEKIFCCSAGSIFGAAIVSGVCMGVLLGRDTYYTVNFIV